MDPQIELLSSVQINWPAFRATIDRAMNTRPDRVLSQYPVDFKDDAEFLLYLANVAGISIANPLNVLRTLPHGFLNYLHYTMMIACDGKTYNEFNSNTRLDIIVRQVDINYILLVTGPLAIWYDTIVLNLARDWKYSASTRLLIDKLLLLFDKQGLKELFANYNRKPLNDGTFLLEFK